MNPALLLYAALAFMSPVSDDQKDQGTADSQPADTQPIDLDKIHGPVYVIQDPKTGETYILVPKTDGPVRGVTYWA